MTQNRRGCIALHDRPVRFYPDDRTRRATLDGHAGRVRLAIVHHGKIVTHLDEPGRIHRTTSAGGAADLAVLEYVVAELEVLAGHPQPVADRHDA